MRSRRRTIALYVLKVTAGVAILAYLLVRYDFTAVYRNLREVDPYLFVLAWFLGLAMVTSYAAMTRVGMRRLDMPLSTIRILTIQFQTRFYSLFMPGGSNSLIKWYKFARPTGQPAQALVILIFTRLVHTVSLLALAAIGMGLDANFPWPRLQWLVIGCALALVLGLLLTVSERGHRMAQFLADHAWVHRFLPTPLASRWRTLWHIVARLEGVSFSELALMTLLAVTGNVLETLQHYTISQAVGLDLSIWVFVWLRGVVVIASVIPVSLAGLGIREAGVVAILVLYAVPEEQALAYSLLYFSGFVLIKGAIGGVLEGLEHYRGGPPHHAQPTKAD